MNDWLYKENCDRCGGSLAKGRIMSMYNKDIICDNCKDEEMKRDDYKEACDADHEQIKKGNYNFEGIGYKK
jgi:reverse gyrase